MLDRLGFFSDLQQATTELKRLARHNSMRLTVTASVLVAWSASALACDIGPQANLKLEPKDQAVLVALGKALSSEELLSGAPLGVLFSKPPAVLTLSAADSQTLARALAGLRKATACHADGIPMQRILEDDTPGIRFLRRIEGCLADACVDNQ